MQESDLQHIRSQKPPLHLDARTPLNLSSAEQGYFVKAGEVDLFLVHKYEERDGFRDFCAGFTEGDILWPVPADQTLKAIAIGQQGAQLVPFDISRVKQTEHREAISSAIDDWLKKITKGILGSGNVPGEVKLIQHAGDISFKADTKISTSEHVYWLKAEDADLTYCDRYGVDRSSLSYIPITHHSWLTVPTDGGYKLKRTPELMDDHSIDELLKAFHSCLLDIYHKKFTEEREQEGRLLKKSIEERESDRFEAFKGLSKVIQTAEEHLKSFAGTKSNVPLVQALDLITGSKGVMLEAPKDLHADSIQLALKEIARHNDLRSQQIKLGTHWWKKESGAMLGFYGEDEQPVALLREKKSYEMHNPATGRVVEVDEQTEKDISEIAYNIFVPFPNRKLTFKDLLRLSLRHVKGDLTMIVFMGLIAALLTMLTPVLTGYIFDNVIPDSSFSELYQVCAALVLAAFAGAAFQATRNIALLRLEGKSNMDLQAGIWDRILKLPSQFFHKFSAGELATRANGFNQIRQLLAGASLTTLLTAIFNSLHIMLLFYYAPALGWIGIGLIVISLLLLSVSVWYRVGFRKKSRNISQKLNGTIQQLLNGISKIKTTGSEGSALLVWAKKFASQVNYNYRIDKNQNLATIFMGAYPIITSGVFFYMVGSSEDYMGLSTGSYLAFAAAFTTVLTAITTLTQTADQLTQAAVIYQNAKPILEAAPEVDENKKAPGTLKGLIEIESLHFSYEKNGPMVLKDISLSIDPGEFVAVVGASGAGKSTLFRLLLGFEKPVGGNIYFDHKNLADLDINLIRRQFGVVLQESRLMAGTLYRNIVGSRTELTMDDAWEAAEKVGLADDIKAMPMNMHTMVSENGGNISGGQKQRLMIARSIIHRPNILLMDEATSALDNHTQKLVSDSLDNIKATRIVIAHRLSTIMHADKIIVLKDGRIEERGNYDQLMSNNGIFAGLANRQVA